MQEQHSIHHRQLEQVEQIDDAASTGDSNGESRRKHRKLQHSEQPSGLSIDEGSTDCSSIRLTPGEHDDLTVLDAVYRSTGHTKSKQWPRGNMATAATRVQRDGLKKAAAGSKLTVMRSNGQQAFRTTDSTACSNGPRGRWKLDPSTMRWTCSQPKHEHQDGEQWWREVEQQMSSEEIGTPDADRRHQMHAVVEQFCLSEAESWEDEAFNHYEAGTNAEGVNSCSRDGIGVKRSSIAGSVSERPLKLNRPS